MIRWISLTAWKDQSKCNTAKLPLTERALIEWFHLYKERWRKNSHIWKHCQNKSFKSLDGWPQSSRNRHHIFSIGRLEEGSCDMDVLALALHSIHTTSGIAWVRPHKTSRWLLCENWCHLPLDNGHWLKSLPVDDFVQWALLRRAPSINVLTQR